ncbi:MAG: hypothetical protein PHF34_04425 [Bacteroidales bacterium]|nr:hypothetical protein [Bacteroidales bacterium]
MEIFTSYYGNLKKLRENNIIPVGISRGIPKWFYGNNLQYLAPTYAVLSLKTIEEYAPAYIKLLERFDIDRFRDDLRIISNNEGGKDIALLCYEKPGEFCHRRLFAEWFKEKVGYDIKEFGYTEKKEPDVIQGSLF